MILIEDVKEQIKQNGALSVTEDAIRKAKESREYNIFLYISSDRAIERAKKVEAGEITGRLAGVPFAVKDNFLHFDGETTAASNILKTFEAPYQAEAIERLENEGAICIGAVNMDAFGHGSSTENSAFGVTKNAYDKERVAGGSSGGSAVAVAKDIVPFALGTDTGGSIRQPASFNGVVGIKPTYGMVSRYGVVSMASGTDTVGALANSVEDIEIVMDIIAGKDEKDGVTYDNYFKPGEKFEKKKIGIVKEFMTGDINDDVKDMVYKAKDIFEKNGYEVEEVSVPMIEYALAMYYVIVPAEISSNLGRYDGVRYGKRAEAKTLPEVYKKSRSEGFVDENKRRILIGSFVLSSGFYDAYYEKAQKARTLLINDFNKAFEKYDALIGSAVLGPAFKIGENSKDPIKMYLEDIMTTSPSLAGIPSVCVPVSKIDSLPVGLQIMGPQKSDSKVLSLAKIIEGNRNDG